MLEIGLNFKHFMGFLVWVWLASQMGNIFKIAQAFFEFVGDKLRISSV